MRGATNHIPAVRDRIVISTHTPLAGRDSDRSASHQACGHFNSHAPCGARRTAYSAHPARRKFQLTRPLRGATYSITYCDMACAISTHTPLAGRDFDRQSRHFDVHIHFNSHAPCGARLHNLDKTISSFDFNSHAPCGARRLIISASLAVIYFNSHAPCGARLDEIVAFIAHTLFQLTRPLRGATADIGVILSSPSDFNSHAPCGARRLPAAAIPARLLFQLTRPLRGATRCPLR